MRFWPLNRKILTGTYSLPGTEDSGPWSCTIAFFRRLRVTLRCAPEYPNGMEDVKRLVGKIAQAGMLPGIHIHYNKADKEDAYVTPRPDPRLSLTANFTLRDALDSSSRTITVEENPRECTMDDERRILKMQDELISYGRYTVEPPYQFLDCQRGALGSHASSYPVGARFGLLDVDTWPIFVRLTQDTSIQEEVAQRLATIYRDGGFKFVYFDGAEDVPGPSIGTPCRGHSGSLQEARPGAAVCGGCVQVAFQLGTS